ncbi:hypothetical protein SteCoe_12549 [Stentor coeruleus]|uniref:Tubulin--tyrosine ligase-like protein 9 n=1 Tax=Stentor coeruleus TaxID=5963 RepID=A0A1R2CAL4_9CILI|nr:hypothetical protein SteCoe_12549 [Stentor coeruleus]
MFINRFNEIGNLHSNKERTPAKHCEKNMWLIKPAALNQGKGIEVCRTLKEIVKSFRCKPINSLWVIQKYIEKPMLFKGRKFDIRIWAVATGKHEFFYYKHGYLRTSSSEYDTQATDNYIHLTNNCLQKYGENYGMYEKGNTLSFKDFQDYLDTEFSIYNLDFNKDFLPRIKDLMIDVYLSGKKTMHKSKRKSVFEFLGFDFLIDEDFRVWLIEANTNPYLGIPNDYINNLLPIMLDDLLDITLDQYIPPKVLRDRTDNDFELLYAEYGSTFSKEGLNQRQSYSTPIYPKNELAQVPMCKQYSNNKNDEDPPKPIVKDLLQTVKHIVENSATQEISEFTEITSRVISQINNWELLSEEQLNKSLQALQIIATGNGAAVFIESDHINSIFNLVNSENVSENTQVALLETVILAWHNMKFRKEIVKKGIIPLLVNLALSSCITLRDISFKGLQSLCINPTKGVYIPGKSREHTMIKEKLLVEGGVLGLIKIAKDLEGNEDTKEKSEEIMKILNFEYHIIDWETLRSLIEKSLNGQHVFPSVLDKDFLVYAKEKIDESNKAKRAEIRSRLERDKARKEEEDEFRKKQSELLKMKLEEKKQKAEEYIKKRYEEIRKIKINELKKQNKFSRTIEDKLVEEKRHALLIKLKKAEELEVIQEFKIKQQEQLIKKNELVRKRRIQERKKLFLHESSRFKPSHDRAKSQKRAEDRDKLDFDKTFTKLYYKKRTLDKLESIDDSFLSAPDMHYNKLESSKLIGSLVYTHKGKKSIRKISPMTSKKNLFKIYGRAFVNSESPVSAK